MKILEYNDVDPLQVLNLTLLALDFPLTPERAAHIRRTDPRLFPCLTLNAVEDDDVVGVAGILRLPMISTEGREDVGGVWAVSTHPHHAGRGVASALLEEAHARMQDAGLRFSMLLTERHLKAYKLYHQHGYAEMNVWAKALARWETAHLPTRLRAQPASTILSESKGQDGYDFVEKIFKDIAGNYLGFAWRHKPFARLREKMSLDDIWIVRENDTPVGYIYARKEGPLLETHIHLLHPDIDVVEAIAVIASKLKAPYVQVGMSRPSHIAGLKRAGWQVTHPNWASFMVKPLLPELTADDARRLFGIGTDRFLISWLDVT
jgi:GNAT superfamily N-acetyltransferase